MMPAWYQRMNPAGARPGADRGGRAFPVVSSIFSSGVRSLGCSGVAGDSGRAAIDPRPEQTVLMRNKEPSGAAQ